MATLGPTKSADVERVAASLVRAARSRRGISQRALAQAAGMPHSTVARIEAGAMQPTLPVLYRVLAAADFEPRIRLEDYDDHDDVLDALAERFPDAQARAETAKAEMVAALRSARHAG